MFIGFVCVYVACVEVFAAFSLEASSLHRAQSAGKSMPGARIGQCIMGGIIPLA